MPKLVKLQTVIITFAGFFFAIIGLSYFFLNIYPTNMPAKQDATLEFAKRNSFQAENAPPLAKSEPASLSMETPAQPIPKVGLKIIKTGSLRFQVKDYHKSRTVIIDFVKKYGAYLASENEEHHDDNIQNNMAIRVPAAQFDTLLDSLAKESVHLENKTVEAQDVTAEFIDVEARLKAKEAVEERYMIILNQAHSVKDILDIESQLGIIREAIDTTEGQLKYLNDQVMYSTISLTFYQSIKSLPELESGFWYNISTAFVKGWNAFLSIIIGMIYLWPFLIIVGGLVMVYRKFWKKTKNA